MLEVISIVSKRDRPLHATESRRDRKVQENHTSDLTAFFRAVVEGDRRPVPNNAVGSQSCPHLGDRIV